MTTSAAKLYISIGAYHSELNNEHIIRARFSNPKQSKLFAIVKAIGCIVIGLLEIPYFLVMMIPLLAIKLVNNCMKHPKKNLKDIFGHNIAALIQTTIIPTINLIQIIKL